MAPSPAKKSVKKIFEKKTVLFWPFLAHFLVLKYFLGFALFALEKAECFEDNSFYSLLNFYGGKYIKSALQALFFIFLEKSRKVGLTWTVMYGFLNITSSLCWNTYIFNHLQHKPGFYFIILNDFK